MCGLVAVVGKKLPSLRKFKTAVELQNHRGPDNIKFLNLDNALFGFCRLSIIDLSQKSNQPVKYKNITLMLNGEIYNYIELSQELKKYGFKFKSKGDSEVMAAAILFWGAEKAFKKARGMWAIVAYDNIEKKIIVSRDRLGIKPLWFFKNNDSLIFSSEIKSILHLFPEAKQINNNTLSKYLIDGELDTNYDSFFKKIFAFPRGSFISEKNKHINLDFKKYWSLKNGNKNKDFENSIKNEIDNTMKLHLRRDVKLGVALSGGFDSTLISYFTKSDKNIFYYSVLPPDATNESENINQTVKQWSLNHKYTDCEDVENLETIDFIIKKMDQPFKSSKTLYQYAIRKQASRDGIKVFLTGDGADEVFAGYSNCVIPYLSKFLIKGNFLTFIKKSYELQEFSETKPLKLCYLTFRNLFTRELLKRKNEPISKINLTLKGHLKYRLFEEGIPYWLRVEDAISMMNSLETRVPFLDHRLIEEAFNVNESHFFENGFNKSLLRKICTFLPKHIVKPKIKLQRPGSTKRIIFDVLGNVAEECFRKDRLIISKEDLQRFKVDKQNRKNAQYWFRVLLALRWIEIFIKK